MVVTSRVPGVICIRATMGHCGLKNSPTSGPKVCDKPCRIEKCTATSNLSLSRTAVGGDKKKKDPRNSAGHIRIPCGTLRHLPPWLEFHGADCALRWTVRVGADHTVSAPKPAPGLQCMTRTEGTLPGISTVLEGKGGRVVVGQGVSEVFIIIAVRCRHSTPCDESGDADWLKRDNCR